MYQQTSRKQCVICQLTRDNTYQNPICKHSYCLNCVQHNKISKVCIEKDCQTLVNQNEMLQFFDEAQRTQKQELTAKQYNNNSIISTQSSIKSSIINKSKQYASPNEQYYDQRSQYSKNTKVEPSATLNYCAVCLFYIKDDQLKQQIQVKKNYPILDCQLHTICVGCFSNYFNHPKNKPYYCEICSRLNK